MKGLRVRRIGDGVGFTVGVDVWLGVRSEMTGFQLVIYDSC